MPSIVTGLMAALEQIGNLSLQASGSDQDAQRFYEDLVRNIPHDAVSLSEHEQQILDLYDSLKEAELECSLLEAQKTVQPGDLRSRRHGSASADPRQCLWTRFRRATSWTIKSGKLRMNFLKPKLPTPYGTRSSRMSL